VPKGASPGNSNAAKHGLASERQIRPAAARQRRNLLRQFGTRSRDLSPAARAYLNLLARTTAKIELADAWLVEHAMIDEHGEVAPIMRVYVSLTNSARLLTQRLEQELRAAGDDGEDLSAYLARAYGGDGDS